APEPQEKTIHRLFERAVAEAPHATAVVCGDDKFAYDELNNRAARVASYLRTLGVHTGGLVGISMHRSTDLIVGLLGILKAGAAYLPLDPHFPLDRLRFMVEDAAIEVLLTQSDLAARLPTDGIQTVRLDEVWPAIAQLDPAPSIEALPDQLAYVIYTSGSTGKPKGVMVSHRNVVGFLNAYRGVVGVDRQRISTNVITYAFDTSVEEIFSPLCYGGTLHVVPYETTLDGCSLARYLLDHDINTAYIVPDLLSSVAEAFEEHGGCGELACLITGLAPKKQRILQRFRDISSTLKILNAYGPTEVTYGATAYEFDSATDPERDVPIGRPFSDYQIYIVNDMLEPVPIGVTGEILIGGVGVSRGYLNRPALTAERFIPNTFSTGATARVYRTGDLGRYQDDGTIEFLGRSDSQVKIRGHRIELREIELTVESHPQVTACHVTTCTLAEGDVRLAAYVARTGDQPGDEVALRKHLQHQLPSFMLPSAFVFLDDLPLLPTGKIDQRALPQPNWERAGLADRVVPPASKTEKKLAEIWKEVLKLERAGIHDSFFELGGHSLLAVRVISQIKNSLGVSVSVAQFFERPTVAELAALIESQQQAGGRPFLLHVKTDGTKRPFFCMADSEYMYAMADALGSDQPFYGLRIPGLGQDETPLSTIETMASYCVEAIKTIDSEGPYLIGGHCFGATVALEVSQQMSRDGKRVDVLALLAPDNLTGSKRRVIRFWLHRLRHNIERRRILEALGNRWRSFRHRLALLWDREQYNKSKRYFEARMKARTQYHLSPYAGRILYVWSSEAEAPPSAYRNCVSGSQSWLEVSNGGMRRVVIEGTHTGIFREPGLSQLVEQLKSEFAAAERDARSP
ncbi:amino acid adenylation domain-containing protein, partial [Candidatus Bipolaricaulota bacterium]